MQLDADKSLSQKVFTKGLISSNLKFVEISSLVSISNVKDFLLETLQLSLFEVLFSDFIKLSRDNIMINHFLDI